ncbi:MAG: putative lipid II flippase FtsW [Tenericutes bacterium]|jgi:cell division protein FtsW|nr:putative lipid II flippase FtsW [Mycoplasmatota bacterium]
MKKRYDLLLFIAVTLLIAFGLLMIYSSSYIWADYKFNDPFKYVKMQSLFILTGFILMNIIRKIDYRIYYKKAGIIFGICLLFLILVLIPGIGSIRNGSRSWFGIGSFGIQPSEAAKLGIIIFTSRYLIIKQKKIKDIKKGLLPILLVTLLVFGLIMLQPDFGTGMILVISTIILLFIAGVKMKFFFILGALGALGIVIIILIAPYRIDRIISFIDPWSDPLGTGFQIIQSLYAIGPGGLLGMGLFNSRQKHFYLPEPQTDFIFSIISEELGIVGVLLIILLFGLILYSGIKIALNQKDLFAKYLAFGITFQIIIQAIMNLMVVIGLIPVTGVTLPFLSYGGSSLLISMISVGILLSISKYQE